jgi:hypothetical protein
MTRTIRVGKGTRTVIDIEPQPLGSWFLKNFIGPFLKWSFILLGGFLAFVILASIF